MEKKDIKTIQTTCGELQYYRNWDNEGSVDMINPQTITRYIELKTRQVNINDLGVFFAFGQQQFDEGLKKAKDKGLIEEGEKIYHYYAGMYGTKKGLDEYFRRADNLNAPISDECDPQEVYFYEYNNHECMLSWDGDDDAISLIIGYWGLETARKIERFNAYKEY